MRVVAHLFIILLKIYFITRKVEMSRDKKEVNQEGNKVLKYPDQAGQH